MADSRRKLHYVPLENNPETMTAMVRQLGLSSELAWHDVYSLDDPALLDFLPRPAHALLLVFPTTPAYKKSRMEEDAGKSEYSGSGPNEEVVWFKQTIGNACGLMGLLHAVLNGSSVDFHEPQSFLSRFRNDAIPMSPADRVRMIETSDQLATAHAAAASQGDTVAPEAEADIDLHYVAFVKSKQGNLFELDGSRKGPLLRGHVGPNEDVLGETSIELGPKQFLRREEASGGGELRFSILALCSALS